MPYERKTVIITIDEMYLIMSYQKITGGCFDVKYN